MGIHRRALERYPYGGGNMQITSTPDGMLTLTADSYSPLMMKLTNRIPGIQPQSSKAVRGRPEAIGLLTRTLQAAGLRNIPNVSDPPPFSFPGPIAEKDAREYQKEGIRFLLRQGGEGCVLGDGMRLGKTFQAIRAGRALNSRMVVVCPSYVRGVWHAEAAKWGGDWGQSVYLPAGRKAKPILCGANIVILHYEIVDAWAEALIDYAPRVLCIDECHLIANGKTNRSQAIRKLRNSVEMCWGLTGTLLTNRPADLHNIAETIRPHTFGDFFRYGLRYCDAHKEQVTPTKTVWKFDGASHLGELAERVKYFCLRRIAEDVALELPPKTRQTVWVDIPAKKALISSVNKASLRAALDRSADAKLPAVTEAVLDAVSQGQRVVCFCWRRGVVEHLVNAARGAGLAAEAIHGGISAQRRGASIEKAKGVSGGHLLAATIDTTGTGIDLSYADGAFFAELTYEPHEILQAEARLINYGTPRPTFVTYFLGRGSIDEIIAEKVLGKLSTFEAVVGRPDGGKLDFQDDGDFETRMLKAVQEWVG